MVQEFKPDLILISCGFDGALHDHLGWSNLSAIQYEYMTSQLNKICEKVLVIQEGGYNVEFLGQHASGVATSLINGPKEQERPRVAMEPTACDIELGVRSIKDVDVSGCQEWALKNIEETRNAHQAGWKCLKKE